MFRKFFAAASAGAAMIVVAPALAAGPGGHGGGGAAGNAGARAATPNGGANVGAGAAVRESARTNSQGSVKASENAKVRANENSAIRSTTNTGTSVRANSNDNVMTGSRLKANSETSGSADVNVDAKARAKANIGAIERANANSSLARGSVEASALPGLTTGLNVQTSGGVSLGTVSQVVTGTDGSIRLVIVTSPTGQAIRLMPNQLSISGGVVTTAQANLDASVRAANSQGPANANIRAIERANANSVLARNSVLASALPGLATGLNVQTSTGVSIGTVSQIVTGTDGSIRLVLVTDTDGQIIRLMPNQLSISGGVVTTTQANVSG